MANQQPTQRSLNLRLLASKLFLFASLAILVQFAVAAESPAQSAPVSTSSADGASRAPESHVDHINQMVEQVWSDYELRPSKPASDGEWCRRLFLDVIGRIPNVKELNTFLSNKDEDKRQKLVDMLLYDDEYTEEFARNWTTVWTNLLIGRTGGNDRNSMISREGMQKYLRDSFAREKPYDKMVHELVTATGTTTPGDADFNGATNFLIDKVNEEKAALATAETTKTFLGLQVQCTQCHNHPFNDWKQQKYWEMNAFFRQVRAYPGGRNARDGGIARLVDEDFAGDNRNRLEEAEIYYELRNGIVNVAYPVFVDGEAIDRSGYVNVVNRREKLADLMINSPYFHRSIVNRMWAHFMGYGFTSPVDDLGPHNTPTNSELLDYLASEFKAADNDLRTLISWIALSRPYGLSSSRTRSNEKDDPLLGESPKFSHFYLRQMEAEQLYESLLVATQADQEGSYEEQERRKNTWLRQFTTAFGTDEGQESTSFNGTIPQVLMLFNGDMIREATSTKKGSLINRLANADMNDVKKVEQLFLAGLSRRPNGKERDMAKAIFAARSGNKLEALKDVWWVILNTNEFIFNH
jgi:hypothetical protein